MTIESMYGLLILAAFAVFAVGLAFISESTEAYLKVQGKRDRRS